MEVLCLHFGGTGEHFGVTNRSIVSRSACPADLRRSSAEDGLRDEVSSEVSELEGIQETNGVLSMNATIGTNRCVESKKGR